jgi:hypothetical protein
MRLFAGRLKRRKWIDFKPPAELFQVKINILWKSGLKERSTYIESYKAIKPENVEKKS